MPCAGRESALALRPYALKLHLFDRVVPALVRFFLQSTRMARHRTEGRKHYLLTSCLFNTRGCKGAQHNTAQLTPTLAGAAMALIQPPMPHSCLWLCICLPRLGCMVHACVLRPVPCFMHTLIRSMQMVEQRSQGVQDCSSGCLMPRMRALAARSCPLQTQMFITACSMLC